MVLAFQSSCFFFFFNDTATTEIYTLSLHDALPIYIVIKNGHIIDGTGNPWFAGDVGIRGDRIDRKSTRLNSSHGYISYAVFCLKKKKKHYASYLANGNCRS